MKYQIVHELPGRIRFRVDPAEAFSVREAAVVAALLETQPGIARAQANWRTRGVLVNFAPQSRDAVLMTMTALTKEFYGEIAAEMPAAPERQPGLAQILLGTAARVAFRSLFPLTVRNVMTAWRALPYFRRGLGSLVGRRRLNVSVLDAAAIAASMLQRDFRTASTVMYLLGLGDELEEWTHRRSRQNLSDSLQLKVDSVWLCGDDGVEREIPARLLKKATASSCAKAA